MLLYVALFLLVSGHISDADMDIDMELDDFEFELFQEQAAGGAPAEEKSTGMGETGVTRVENTVQTIETKLTELDELERKILIAIDNDMNNDKAKMSSNKVDAAKSSQKISEEKEQLNKLKDIRPRLKQKMREVIKVLPKREQYRLIRKMDLRHRFSLGTEMDTS
ncbi:hypothetical protein EIN_091940 [Entamoeba invadens IP1]|uniref:Uncharacterized protein n=2 Tax=Entamoeba invadens TaxID=33085 RepID=A0A0A1TYQ6_ENTIV|nr:hypothetical protein EIN_091940 [Entamoeba invadens IP1]ELP86629.1 hypothetical protein EIN_091940 [Entamoeba invadens IP1]BAN42216.1 hypothetical protein [Entamoeba invadens]|eukprot:XP_004185975.1 hypothetical protein EIN_091940 [Entamoeba invadens IP1]